MPRRSSIERQPPRILAAVHKAICEGATIDEIVGRIRELGGTCSRSAVTRYVRGAREKLDRWHERRGQVDFWLDTIGEHPEGGTGRLALERLRGLAMNAAEALEKEEEPPDIEKFATLALAMQRIESAGRAGRSGANRASAREPEPKKAWPPDPDERKNGLSLETVAHIRAAVEGNWGQEMSTEEGEAALQAFCERRARDAQYE